MANVKKNWLNFLSQDDIRQIDQASRRVLIEIGVRLEDEDLKAKLLDQGCSNHNQRVQFTTEIIDQTIAGLQSELVLGSRSGKKLHIKDGEVVTHTGAWIPAIYDLENGHRRNATLKDLEDMVRLMNHLDNLSMPGAVILPQDVPTQISEIVQAATLFRHCQKPVNGLVIFSSSQAPYGVELYKAMSGAVDDMEQYPLMIMGISPESPLYFPQHIVDVMKAFITEGIPTIALVAPLLGFTAPLTISGGLTQMNACILAYTIMSQQINPATPVFYGARLALVNMRTTHSIWGVPEVGLIGACSAQLARYYGFPSDVYGYSSTACAHDPQLGAEAAINGLLPLLAGANVISGFGSFASGYLSSFEDLIIDNEIFAMHQRVAQGLAVDTDHLAVDVIADAINGQDYYLQPHTHKHLRSGELFQPQVGFYGSAKEWEEKGAKDMAQKAREEAREILAHHEDTPLPAEVEREFERILESAKRELT